MHHPGWKSERASGQRGGVQESVDMGSMLYSDGSGISVAFPPGVRLCRAVRKRDVKTEIMPPWINQPKLKNMEDFL